MAQMISAGNAIIVQQAHRTVYLATKDPARARAALLAQGYTAATADAVTSGLAVLADPYPNRDWMFNREERT